MKIILILLSLTVSLFSFSAGAPANDNCGSAYPVRSLDGACYSTTSGGVGYTSANATTDVGTPGCFDNKPHSVWYSFTAQGGEITVTVNGSSPEVALLSFTTPCTAAGSVVLDCDAASGAATSATLQYANLTVGTTYYIVVDEVGNNGAAFSLCVNNPVPPANNNCSSAQSIPAANLNGTCVNGNNTSATADTYTASCWNTTVYPGGGQTVWYSFVAQGFEATVNISGGASSYPAAAIYGVTSGGNICNSSDALSFDCSGYASGTSSSTTAQVVGYPLTIGQTYYVAVTLSDYFANSGAFQICINNPVPTAGQNCFSAAPFCTGTSYSFPANTNTALVDDGSFGCLLSQANPAWYYLEIANSGNLDITMTNSNNRDIDFILWGPFASVSAGCAPGITNASQIEDCSYSTSATEVANITGATVGERYIMLITNFSNVATNISFSQTGGTGSTNCAILPIELMYFKGKQIDSYNVFEWATASEIDNDYFEIENSADGENWRSVGLIDGAGTSTELIEYSKIHFDFAPIINYYRLKQVDMDGRTIYSEPISIDNRHQEKTVVSVMNLLGQKVDSTYKGVIIINYSDGSNIKSIQ